MSARILWIFLIGPAYSNQFEDDLNVKESSQVEVRAVFINCQIDDKHIQYGSEISRFEREEFFKHNALRDCKKKLALTVKITNNFGHSSSDEYIPIEHVFDDSNKKRVRLLNPYILRLRREAVLEAYSLQKLDTFSGLLTSSNEDTYTHREMTNNRLKRARDLAIEDQLVFNDKDETHDGGNCPRTKPMYNSNMQRKKSIPFEVIRQTAASYRKERDAFSLHKNIPSSKNVTNNLQSQNVLDSLEGTEKSFHMYEVGEPNVLFKATVQLLEKLSTPEGKTIWRDLTKQEARISSLCPEWSKQDVNIRYRSSQNIPKEDFTLPSTGICLLLPQNGKSNDGLGNVGDFIIVPIEDIEAIGPNVALKRSHGNSSTNNASGSDGGRPRRILVRISRALFGRNEDNFIIINEGSRKYLTIPYRQPHRAQIELEAKADENKLVYVGSSGRLTVAVSESTRRTRAVLTMQVTNTGLAAARFRPKIRECTPEVMYNDDEDRFSGKPVLIPPMHTHKFSLEIPFEMPGDIAHCSVVLLNEGAECIAVRDVRIKRGDRCFCVWHCQCVCLNEDPKLLCQEMPEYEQVAAGLTPRERPRQVRAACYPDIVTINLLVIAFGVVILLIVLGLLKACLGLLICYVGTWGINHLIQTPRKLDHYYERSLRSRPVVFDEDGWPVHPDTKKRTVRLISKQMEFVLNVIFFVAIPCVMLGNSLKLIMSRCQNKECKSANDAKTKKWSCAEDLQGKDVNKDRFRLRRRRRYLSKWMSPQAQELSTDIWRNGLSPHGHCPSEYMRPLLRDNRFRGNKVYNLHSPVVDSEQEDTEYVLMQMQHSRESLSKDLQKFQPSSIID